MTKDYAGLKAELALSKYGGMTDAAIATALETANITVYSQVPASRFEDYFFAKGFMLPLQSYAGASPPSGATAAAIEAAKELALMMQLGTSVDLADPTVLAKVQSRLDALVAEGTAGRLVSTDSGAAFASADKAALLAMGTSTTSRAAQLGFGPGDDMVQEIAAARKGVWS